MSKFRPFHYFLLQLFILGSVSSSCIDLDIPPLLKVNETVRVGTVVLTFSHSNDTWFDLNIHLDGEKKENSEEKLNGYFSLDTTGDTSRVVVERVPDLEALYVLVGHAIQNLSLEFNCHSSVAPTSEVFSTELVITAVDEFQPVFVGAPFKVFLPEDTEEGSAVFDLEGLVRDNDVLSSEEIIYHVHQYGIIEFDGRNVFDIPDQLKGEITLKRNVDFDIMNRAGRLFYMLNVSAQDSGGLQAHTTVNFTITDVDDLGPVFDIPGCKEPCEQVSLTSYTTENYTGILLTEPWQLKAKDQDSLNSTVIYLLKEEENVTEFFEVDRHTGTLYQVKTLDGTDFRTTVLYIEAVEVDSNRTIYANISVNVTDKEFANLTRRSDLFETWAKINLVTKRRLYKRCNLQGMNATERRKKLCEARSCNPHIGDDHYDD